MFSPSQTGATFEWLEKQPAMDVVGRGSCSVTPVCWFYFSVSAQTLHVMQCRLDKQFGARVRPKNNALQDPTAFTIPYTLPSHRGHPNFQCGWPVGQTHTELARHIEPSWNMPLECATIPHQHIDCGVMQLCLALPVLVECHRDGFISS